MLSLNYSSYSTLNYLNHCDFIYKYNLESINSIPAIDKIVIELPTNLIPEINTLEDDYQGRFLLKCYLFFYFISQRLPFINCNNFKNSNIKLNNTSNFQYSFLLTNNKAIDIMTFLSFILNENDKFNNNIKNLTSLSKILDVDNKNKFLNIRLDCQIVRLVEYKDLLNLIFTSKELQKLKFQFNIVVKNFNKKILTINECKNFIYLWNI